MHQVIRCLARLLPHLQPRKHSRKGLCRSRVRPFHRGPTGRHAHEKILKEDKQFRMTELILILEPTTYLQGCQCTRQSPLRPFQRLRCHSLMTRSTHYSMYTAHQCRSTGLTFPVVQGSSAPAIQVLSAGAHFLTLGQTARMERGTSR